MARGQVEDLEDPLEADQRGHQVDPGVGELRQRAVELGDVQGRARRRCRPRGRAVDDDAAADEVDERGRERADEPERGEQRAAVHRGADPDVGDPLGAVVEQARLAVGRGRTA
jgi:hypothetical protein